MTSGRIEIWGGCECSFVKVGNIVRDQIAETGHETRTDDLAAVAALGITTLRYPMLWEKVAPRRPDQCNWGWHDERLGVMQRLSVKPIAGLLHHGGGPAYTSLLDREFPETFARYAGQVARRYPSIDHYTPINEPLTTARFSGLYGHWSPHRRSVRSFLRILVNQCNAIRLAMAAVREVNASARLVQTEDVGKCFATAPLRRQADYENLRRWLSLDLLTGRIDTHHPWWSTFLKHGIEEAEIRIFGDGASTPDVIGFDHYLTSERYLDHDLAAYPRHMHPAKTRRAYVDLEATRADFQTDDLGPTARLRELWERYRRPIAVTEVHHDGAREEQLRWLGEIWRSVHQARGQGVDVRAVTVWSLFGAVDWNSLLTRKAGYYESGAFDIRAPVPRTTAVGHAVKALAGSAIYDHPVLDAPGWWKRPNRFHIRKAAVAPCSSVAQRRILIVGESGFATALREACDQRGLAHVAFRAADFAAFSGPAAIKALSPWAVVDAISQSRNLATAMGAKTAVGLAGLCAEYGWPLLAFSSERVFSGAAGRPYDEDDKQDPPDAFGRILASVERRLLQIHPRTLILRCGPIFGLVDRVKRTLALTPRAGARRLSGDVVISPAFAPDVLRAALDLLIDDERGIWHLANAGTLPFRAFTAQICGSGAHPVQPVQRETDATTIFGNFALTSRRGWIMPSLDSAISRFVAAVGAADGRASATEASFPHREGDMLP